jgi:hypothetical protein
VKPRQLTRSDALQPAPEHPARQRVKAREDDRPAVPAEPHAPLDHAVAGEREQQQDDEEHRQQRDEHRECEQQIQRPLDGEREPGRQTSEPLGGPFHVR